MATPKDSLSLQAENDQLRLQVTELQESLAEATATLEAISSGHVDAVVVDRGDTPDIFALAAADRYYFQLAQESARIGTWDWDLRTQKVYWTEGIFLLLGLDSRTAEPSMELWRSCVHPDDRDWVFRYADAVLAASGRDSFESEFRVQRPDGSVSWLASRGRVLRDATGTATRFIGVNFDITDRKLVEEALVESELQFRKLADSMPQMVWAARPDGLVDYYNRRWYECTGAPHGGTGDDSFIPFIHPDDTARTIDTWYASVNSGAAYSIEYRIWSKADKSYRWFLGRGLPIRNDEGAIVRWFGTCTDIDELKAVQRRLTRSEELLRDADRRKDEFLAMLAHELRNPLAPIQTGLDLLALERPDSGEVLEVMRDQVDHLVRLVDDLLDVSRIMRGRVQLQQDNLELATLVRRTAAAVAGFMQARQQTLTLHIDDEPLWAFADGVRLTQVLSNLLNNAAKYSDRAASIECSLRRSDNQAVIEVRDNGTGIGPDFLPHVFELFAQATRSLDRAQGGLGIGLTLVKSLVEMHGGTVHAASEGLGKGSCFTVRLPLSTAVSSAAATAAVTVERQARRVLVVDDNVSCATLVARLLQKVGSHEVRIAYDGRSALHEAEQFAPEVVFLDIGLPGMDGYELARALRSVPVTKDALLVAVTGYGQEQDRRRSREAGFDVHLVKPTSHKQLDAVFAHERLQPHR